MLSSLRKFFVDSNKEKVPTPQEGIQRLREAEEMLQKKSDFVEKQIEEQLNIAKNNKTKNKRAALRALKTKKRLEKNLQQIDGTLSTIELQRENLESATSNAEVFKVIGQTSRTLKNIHDDLDVDKVSDLMDDIAEQQEISEEIARTISNPIGFGDNVDEDELLAELDELEQEDLDKRLLDLGPEVTANLPSVPTADPVISKPMKARQVDDDPDMRELEMWAN